jgi:hypothetical protein
MHSFFARVRQNMTLRRVTLIVCLLPASLPAACGSLATEDIANVSPPTVPADAEGAEDADVDPSHDAAPDATRPSPRVDASTGPEGGAKGGPDGAPDAALPPSNPNLVTCGSTECSRPDQICCVRYADAGPVRSCVGGADFYRCETGMPVACDEAADCPPGLVCCLSYWGNGLTMAGCAGQCSASEMTACKAGTPCPTGSCAVRTCTSAGSPPVLVSTCEPTATCK